MSSPCICVSVRKASRKLTSRYDAALAPEQINLAQFSLLRKIERHGPASLTALSTMTDLDRSTLGRNIRLLERLDLVDMRAGKDQREQLVSLTETGRHKLQRATPLWAAAQADITSRLGGDNVARLEALLDAL